MARRRAQSAGGKKDMGATSGDRTRGASPAQAPTAAPARPEPQAPAPAAPPRPAPAAPRGRKPVTAAGTAREVARRRRAALATDGRKADQSRDRTRAAPQPARPAAEPRAAQEGSAGKAGGSASPPARADGGRAPVLDAGRAATTRPKPRKVDATKSPARAVSMARRAARAASGKGASNSATSAAGIARQSNPKMSSRELARAVREQRSQNGRTASTKSAPCGRVRPSRQAGDGSEHGARDASWKVGASETGGGQTVTGTRVGRAMGMTGDEASTCRTITGTEYMGADIFREFCHTDPAKTPRKVSVSGTGHGSRTTGTAVGRSERVTGDEPGTCKIVTGTEYLAPEQQDAFCGAHQPAGPAKVSRASTGGGQPVSGTMVGRATSVTGDEHGAAARLTGSQYAQYDMEKGRPRGTVPPKVGVSVTLSGGTVTGTRTGRSERVTGDEPGSCRMVTGNEYADLNQYEAFCKTKPEPTPAKVSSFHTLGGQTVSGTRTGRSAKVTGDEPGTCKAVTGTPYGSTEDLQAFCDASEQRAAAARWRPMGGTPGADMTGIQPGIDGVMTGAERGACENVSGTPYVGKGEYGASCGALPGQDDFPQPLDGAPWQSFSVTSPARQAFQARERAGITGTRYEQGQITGPFNQGTGKVTGTEEFRFDHRRLAMGQGGPVNLLTPEEPVAPAAAEAAPERARVTGEGQSAGLKITGDDWERNERVTGTEGSSSMRRNPTRRGGPMSAMPAVKRNTEVAEPVSLVTGSAGTTNSGALITYSGGARG